MDMINVDIRRRSIDVADSGRIIRGGYATWDDIVDKPETFPPSPHTHSNYIRAAISSDNQTLVLYYDE